MLSHARCCPSPAGAVAIIHPDYRSAGFADIDRGPDEVGYVMAIAWIDAGANEQPEGIAINFMDGDPVLEILARLHATGEAVSIEGASVNREPGLTRWLVADMVTSNSQIGSRTTVRLDRDAPATKLRRAARKAGKAIADAAIRQPAKARATSPSRKSRRKAHPGPSASARG